MTTIKKFLKLLLYREHNTFVEVPILELVNSQLLKPLNS